MLLRMSSLFLRTLRDDPADAEVPSHKLLVRAGYVRRVAPGIYSWLPLGKLVLENVTRVVREEMNRMGGQEVLFPALLPREYYEATGRWTEYGDTLFRLQGPQGRRLPSRPHARGALHRHGQGRILLLQGLSGHALPDPDQIPRRGAAPGGHPARARVPDEGLLLLRPRRRRPQALLRGAPRDLHQDVRPAGHHLQDRVSPRRARWAARPRRSSWPPRPPARTRSWPATPAATPPTPRPSPRPPPPPAPSTACRSSGSSTPPAPRRSSRWSPTSTSTTACP